ncbi:hypothetical protein NEOLEDRAFT_1127329 [Neolentinus lepideus HHB14362 ss-1]|uniref:Cytochrome c domain-containing protein n=1 Tax=Neolentinus lepideus HHB14362 ss-1 TaxID=1314782 RepID=A0A165VFS7_9AGAM|nr:hypothetical protein NEOLEDRAFT_1127329 [Neolentinus lepideus HHB14362 ss-1]
MRYLRLFYLVRRRSVAAVLVSGGVVGGHEAFTRSYGAEDSAKAEFETSSKFPIPQDYRGLAWQIRNDYPATASKGDAPWADIDFKKHPERFCDVIKRYCMEGNKEVDFNVQNNKKRNWYHAAWLHYAENGREPLHGLTFERPVSTGELSANQKRPLQAWTCGYYNELAATVFSRIWKDGSSPQWDDHVKFPNGAMVFKLLMVDAKDDEEAPILKGAPMWDAVIVKERENYDDPDTWSDRNDYVSKVRLLQVDYAIADQRSPIGWIWGSFMYDGRRKEKDPWERLTPFGLQWGNDPQLDQEAYEAGARVKESWVNPAADELLRYLHSSRPMWGWNGRLNGPADNFISACASCHSTAVKTTSLPLLTQDSVIHTKRGAYVPAGCKNGVTPGCDAAAMEFFRNIPAGKPYKEGQISADYSLQLMMGWINYQHWLKDNEKEGWVEYVMRRVTGRPRYVSTRRLARMGASPTHVNSDE